MSYQAFVTKIQTAPHPNADRLQIAYCRGAKVIVGLDAKDGDLYVYFDSDGRLLPEFLKANDLIAGIDENGNRNGGYFNENGKVRAQNFRGVKSEGFACPLSYFAFTGYDVSSLEDGDSFDTLNGIKICEKAYTKATLAYIGGKKKIRFTVDMPEHYETAQFRFVNIPIGSIVHISSKSHGISFRYGNVMTHIPTNWWQKILYRKNMIDKRSYVLGTRRAILPKINEYEFGGGFYGNGDPYTLAANMLHGKLHEDEIIYGEVVGYLKTGAALFKHDTSKLPEIKKEYGEDMVYSYGCIPSESKIQVYRITQNGRELSWFELLRRCEELSVDSVYHINSVVYDGDRDKLNAMVESLLEGPEFIDPMHIREGICLRIESTQGIRICKAKSWSFKVLEGIQKTDEDYIDMEEAA